jgi:excisionase family DNA binding protein
MSDLLSVKELIELYPVSKGTIYSWVKRKLIKSVRINGSRKFFFKKEDVDKLLNGGQS